MGILALQNRVKVLEEKVGTEFIQEGDKKVVALVMSLEQQIQKLEEQLLKESQFRNADYELIERLDKRIRELELRAPKKRGRKPRVNEKMGDDNFE